MGLSEGTLGTDEVATVGQAYAYFADDLPACDYVVGTDEWDEGHGYPIFVIVDITDPDNPIVAYQESTIDQMPTTDFAEFIGNL